MHIKDELICGNCKCYTAYQFHAETGRCRRYNITVQLRTKCLDIPDYKCNHCIVSECMDKRKEEE